MKIIDFEKLKEGDKVYSKNAYQGSVLIAVIIRKIDKKRALVEYSNGKRVIKSCTVMEAV